MSKGKFKGMVCSVESSVARDGARDMKKVIKDKTMASLHRVMSA